MKTLTIFKDDNRVFQMMQTVWAGILNPFLSNPVINGVPVTNVLLTTGVTQVNHKLGRTPQGWFVTDTQGSAAIYRSAPFDPLILTLTSNQTLTVNLYVF